MRKVAFAIAAHPDDIEFMMGGTLLQLGLAGWELHYMNIANGSCGTATMDRRTCVLTRDAEAREAAAKMGAHFHEPLVDDLMVYYTPELISRLGSVVRRVDPTIVLLQSPQDYMEDHINASRLGVTATFCRGMLNFQAQPPVEPVASQVAVYHALPHGLIDQLRQPVVATHFVDVADTLAEKREALACHRSQKEWLDTSQGMDSYLITMEEMTAEMGKMSGRFQYAEGWRRHSHLGFGPEEFNPLADALGDLWAERAS
jgi:LmbE family N-acetylglucosaminyl deacetylase